MCETKITLFWSIITIIANIVELLLQQLLEPLWEKCPAPSKHNSLNDDDADDDQTSSKSIPPLIRGKIIIIDNDKQFRANVRVIWALQAIYSSSGCLEQPIHTFLLFVCLSIHLVSVVVSRWKITSVHAGHRLHVLYLNVFPIARLGKIVKKFYCGERK